MSRSKHRCGSTPTLTSRRPNEIATLQGDVRDVDGRIVSDHGGTFELLAGCHVVGAVESWGSSTYGSTVVVKLPRIAFAMPMRGGYRYIVKVELTSAVGTVHGKASISARETDAAGTVTAEFPALSDEQAAAMCQSHTRGR